MLYQLSYSRAGRNLSGGPAPWEAYGAMNV